VYKDVPEHKQPRELIESLARFPAENPCPVMRIAKDGTLLYANASSSSILKLWGYRQGEKICGQWHDVVLETLSNGTSLTREVECDDKCYSLTFVPPAACEYVNVYGLDRTEAKRVELAVADARTYAESIVATVRQPLLVLDSELTVVSANRSFYRDFRVDPENTVGSLVYELGDGQWDIPELRRLLEEILPASTWFDDFRVEHDFPDIGLRVMLLNGRQVISEGEKTQRILLAIKDITDSLRAEQERERLLKTVAAKNRELQDIIYIASHDLKSPLVNILGFSSELLRDCEQLGNLLGKDQLEQSEKDAVENLVRNEIPQEVKFISSSGHMLKGLIDGMLKVSRIGGAEYSIEPLNMNELMQEVADALEFSIRERGASVTVERLPDCLGDASKTSQLFSNLINNALKYLDPGRKGVIRILGRSENGRSEYCVEDNGIGIDAAHQQKVFEIFHRLNPRDDVGGEGLGLTIAMRILDQMDGGMRLESEPGKGSKFFVSLPGA